MTRALQDLAFSEYLFVFVSNVNLICNNVNNIFTKKFVFVSLLHERSSYIWTLLFSPHINAC